jgi:DNA-binding SARP family transcriptional activator/Tfp pilus assembly protein PilF
MAVLRISLLGGLALAWDGDPISELPGATARSLFAYLVTNRDRPQTRDLLAGIFWPDLPDHAARRRLSQALWQIRRVLEPYSILISDGGSLQLNPEYPVWIDIESFVQAYTQGMGGDAHALEHLETCIGLYRGEFLAGYYDDWLLLERERLSNLYLSALGFLVAGYKSQGQYDQALVHACTLVSQDPWSEGAHREVMRLYHLLGRGAEALKQYETCRRLLEEELGVEPAPETQTLAVEIAARTGLAAPSWLPVAALTPLTPLLERPDRLPLVGRQVELAGVLRQAETAARGQGGVVLLYGEAGVGKTRFLQELAHNVQWRGVRVAWGRCYEMAVPPAYQPLVEIFRADLSVLKADTLPQLWQAELARLVPELASGELPPPLKPEEEKRRIMEAVARGFLALSQAAPFLIIIEDVHWIDRASLEALRYLLPRLAETRLLIVVSARSEDLSPYHAEVLQALENTRIPRRIDLIRLNQAETGELVQYALDLNQPPALFSARLYAETEGNPFFLVETLCALVDEGLLYRDELGAWSTSWDETTADYAALPLPGSVVGSIQRRLDRLPASLAEALNLAAVIGRGVPFGLWQGASDLSDQELFLISDELCHRGLMLCADKGDLPGVTISADYAFAHDQIRRVAYDRLSPPRLRSYHRRVAEALTRLQPDEAETLAYHWSTAQVWDKAINYHQLSGERAQAVYANATAVDHYKLALGIMERLDEPHDLTRQYQIRLALEKTYDLQGERQAQTHELVELEKLAEVLDNNRRRAEVTLRQARQAEITGDFNTAIALAARAAHLARVARDVIVEAESLLEWGWSLLMQGEHEQAHAGFEQVLSLVQPAGNLRLEAEGLHGLGTVCLVIGEYTQAKSYFHQVLDIAHQVDICPRQASTLANLGYIATAQGEHSASLSYSTQALQIHREIGDQRGAALVLQNMADEYLATGEFSTAREYLEQALAIQQVTQAQDNVGGILGALGLLFHRLGAYDRAKQYYTQAMEIFEELGIRWYQGQNLAFQSLLYHHLGDDQRARQLSRQGLEIAREIGDRLAQGWLLDSLGYALTGLGHLDEAAEAFQQALAIRRELLNEPHLTTESLAGLARLAMDRGDIANAMQLVEEILEIQRAEGLTGVNDPFRVRLTCYLVLKACQDVRAGEVISGVYEDLLALRGNIKDPALESSFLEAVDTNRMIISAYQDWRAQYQENKVQIKLPKESAPQGHALLDEGTVLVNWTVSTPEDQMIANKAERRRLCLMRLLVEARTQGAAPTYDHLAQVLSVTRRTIERDMAALRRQGVQVPSTRGKMSG